MQHVRSAGCFLGAAAAELKTATDRTGPERIYGRVNGRKCSQNQGAREGSCGT